MNDRLRGRSAWPLYNGGNGQQEKTMTNRITRAIVAAGVAGALAVPATAAQAGEKTERAIIGALLGGVAGAAVSRDDTSGALIGAAAGAALGAATAKSNNHHRYARSYRTSRSYAYQPRYQYAPRYNSYQSSYSPYSGGYYDQYGYYHR
jgi:hypothetical protein